MAELKKDQYYITTDAVVFTILNNELKILLIKRKNEPFKAKFALPGGFLNIDEDFEVGVLRELTNVKNIFLKQMFSVGKVGRDPRGRIITVPFLAIINGEKLKLHSGDDAELAKWFSVNDLPELGFDHKLIINDALNTLKKDIENTNIAFQIMPEKFTLTELQKAYEIVLGKTLDKRNFRKKLNELGLVKEKS